MSFSEVDLFGVYVAPMSLMMAAAWFILVALRRLADHFGVMHRIWHPALFESRRLCDGALQYRSDRWTLRCGDVECRLEIGAHRQSGDFQ